MSFDIYIAGVGGQGIGLLSQVLLRAADYGGLQVMGVDTHGLAQRGGSVVSRIRCGKDAYSPLTRSHCCRLVVAMEIHEALRALASAMARGGTLVYLDVSWQPLGVRLGQSAETRVKDVEAECRKRDVETVQVASEEIPDPRMQNMALLGTLAGQSLVPGVRVSDFEKALKDLLAPSLFKQNIKVFKHYAC